ncbi:MAG TPA: PRC-barrel domain-containing protein [Burkholderiales bacterium]|nr:PRC-barrel domain-containing protein [Burkholderiales bacterium]
MLRSTKDLEDYAIRATDGIVGHVKDFYFDDKAWVIRYLVVDTGAWLSHRKVLISPIAIGHPDWPEKVLPVSITKEQVKNSPDIDTDKPVSRQQEMHYLGYYGYPFYWFGPGPWGDEAFPSMLIAGYADPEATRRAVQAEAEDAYARAEAEPHQDGDPHLRSCNAVRGYHIEANDGDIGHVQGLLVDEQTWAIRHIIVNTGSWWSGHQVLIAPQSIAAVSWSHAAVSVDLTRQAVKDAPPYDPAVRLD